MILISHRGNIDGPNKVRENSPYYIMEALTMGYDVEVDLWSRHGALYLGHDTYQYQIDLDWLGEKTKNLWITFVSFVIKLFLQVQILKYI